MTQPWPVENVTAMREDASAGLTLRQCALKRGFHEGTVSRHAKLNGIRFPISPHRALTYDELSSDQRRDVQVVARWEKRARENLAREIAAAKAEAPFARPYKGHQDDY